MKTTTNAAAIADLKARMTSLFHKACQSLGIKPLDVFVGSKSHATFLTEREANELHAALKLAGEAADVHHWDPKVDPDFDRDEWQVSWG